jgi:hypothetical protein
LIYLDTSVALAQLLAEDRVPPEALWQEPLISSRLIEYEIWTRIHARKLARSHGDEARTLLGRIALVDSLCRSWRVLSSHFRSPSERSTPFISLRWTLSEGKDRA